MDSWYCHGKWTYGIIEVQKNAFKRRFLFVILVTSTVTVLVTVTKWNTLKLRSSTHLLGFMSRCVRLSHHVQEQRSSQRTANILSSPHPSHRQKKIHVKQQPGEEEQRPHLQMTHSDSVWVSVSRENRYCCRNMISPLTNKLTWGCGAVNTHTSFLSIIWTTNTFGTNLLSPFGGKKTKVPHFLSVLHLKEADKSRDPLYATLPLGGACSWLFNSKSRFLI